MSHIYASMESSSSATHPHSTGSSHFLSNVTVHSTGNMNNAARDINLNYYYSIPHEVSPRDRLFYRSCSRATFNGDTRADAPKCHPETRKSIIASIKPWATDINSESYILWLKGSVGTGKSAVARRVCEELDEDPILLAGGFFWRNGVNRNSLKAFVATIVYRISVVMPEIGKVIEDVIAKDPSVLDSAIEYQWNTLIIKPLCQISPSNITRRSLIVIDGLDECEPSSSQRQLLHLLVTFHQCGLHRRFSFLVCSRPEAHIESEMNLLASQHPTHFLPSFMLSNTKESREDMRLILTLGLRSIYQRRRSLIGNRQWPPAGAIDRIIALARNQFIYVLTVLQWLDGDEGHPVDRLENILKTSCDGKARAFAQLDRLYDLILVSACSKEAGNLVLPCLFLITGRRGCQLADALEVDSDYIQITLQPLHSVLIVPNVTFPPAQIDIYHTSFAEYLHDDSRSSTYCVLNAEVATFVLTKAIRWASKMLKWYGSWLEHWRSTLWLNVHDSAPIKNILFTSDLRDALSQLNARRWLRESLLFVEFHEDKTRNKYKRIRKWIATSLAIFFHPQAVREIMGSTGSVIGAVIFSPGCYHP